MASRRLGRGDPAARIGADARRSRGSVTMTLLLPRYVIAKRLASGRTAFYFNLPKKYRDLGCNVPNTPLGADYAIACGEEGNGGRAAALNSAFDEWDTLRQGLPVTGERAPIYGTIRWL